MQITKDYIEANKERFLEELFGLIRIPSISSESTQVKRHRLRTRRPRANLPLVCLRMT